MIQSLSLDLLIRIKNAYQAGRKKFVTPASNFSVAIAEIVKKNGFIKDYSVTDIDSRKEMTINLKYTDNKPALTDVKIYSKPGRRMYCNSSNIPWGNESNALIIISTSKGLLNQKQAQATGQGGELIAQLW
jgi:small subunit ribosomal protein S8